MVRVNPDPSLVWGVAPTAPQAEITHAYRTHLRAHHPDTRPARSAHAADEHLRQVLAAYALLRDPARRADSDRLITKTQPPPPTVPTPPDHPPAGPVQIPIPHRRHHTHTAPVPPPPLWAGPVR